jgi:hypothetical protein
MALSDNQKKIAWAAGLGAVLFFILRPRKAKASEAPRKSEVLPVPAAGGGMPTPSEQGFVDRGSGVVIAGPSTGITPPPAGAEVPYTTKTVERGESWSNLASRAYGDYRWWPWLWDYNRADSTQFENPDDLKRGSTVKIPTMIDAGEKFKAAIFARAEAHAAHWRCKASGKPDCGPIPVAVMARTYLSDYLAGLGCCGSVR